MCDTAISTRPLDKPLPYFIATQHISIILLSDIKQEVITLVILKALELTIITNNNNNNIHTIHTTHANDKIKQK